jgi:CDGSH-type Zn-finger protein
MSENGKVAGKAPILQDLEKDKTYAWCTCGMSTNQPWCDGSHKGSSFAPSLLKPQENRKAAMCACKQSRNAPFCDGSHETL